MPILVLANPSSEVENTLEVIEVALRSMQEDNSTEASRQRRASQAEAPLAQYLSELKQQIAVAETNAPF
jgi:hypothetical protein